ncbi:MAG TPA: hypothetical protein VFI73_00755 [Candidatus Nitrosopolaris sp.]|nr:hypothetical protein [Candidatus Nitrosopolaris sp.]
MMHFGVDVLGTLSEKLKLLIIETQDHHRSFIDNTKLYREEKINESDFFSQVLNYVVTISALTFLMNRVILELRSSLAKGTSIKDATGGVAPSSSPAQTAGFGIRGFLTSDRPVPIPPLKEALLSRKVEISSHSTVTSPKVCKECRAILSIRAKFCGTCGINQEDVLH